MTDDAIFTLAEALAAQKALRDAAGAKEEMFELADVIGMTSDEIEMLQEQGKSWDEIAAMIQRATGKPVTGKEVEQYYVGPEDRDRWDDEEFEDDDDDR
ncbi:MAG: hypothetical protein HC850_10435 [Rhodomicrobium sp.]|nr:hypothetical protein [Rhodomicrobium sp.]